MTESERLSPPDRDGGSDASTPAAGRDVELERLQTKVQDALPPNAAFLTGPLTNQLQSFSNTAATGGGASSPPPSGSRSPWWCSRSA